MRLLKGRELAARASEIIVVSEDFKDNRLAGMLRAALYVAVPLGGRPLRVQAV